MGIVPERSEGGQYVENLVGIDILSKGLSLSRIKNFYLTIIKIPVKLLTRNKMEVVKMENIKEFLRNTPLKATPQRLAILKEIQEAGHIDLDSIYKNLSESFPSMSLATVYKNIHMLKQYGVIRELTISGAKSKYEIAYQKPHHHLICKVCGKVMDIEVDTNFLKQQLKNLKDFDVSNCDIYCYGVCEDCKHKSRN